jgi:hypothetical protein
VRCAASTPTAGKHRWRSKTKPKASWATASATGKATRWWLIPSAFPNGTLWQNYGVLATLKAHLVERMFRKDANHMEIDSVLTDPDIFTQPYVTKYLYELSDIPITEEECLAGNRDTGTSVDLTPPPLGSVNSMHPVKITMISSRGVCSVR